MFAIINKGTFPGSAPRGIPTLYLDSEWAENSTNSGVSWDFNNNNDNFRNLRSQQGTTDSSQNSSSTEVLMSEFLQAGEGHYQSDFMSDSTSLPFFTNFIAKAVNAMLPGTWSGTSIPTLTTLRQTNGAFIDATKLGIGQATAMTFTQWQAAHPEDPNAKHAFWYIDLDYANAVAAYANTNMSKTPQFVTPVNADGSIQNLGGAVMGAAEYYPTIQSDGVTFQVKATMVNQSQTFRLFNGGPVGIGSAPIKYIHSSGALRQVGPDTFQMCVDRGDIIRQSLPWDNFIIAYNRGDANYRSVDRPIHVNVPIVNVTGSAQTITFPTIPNQVATNLTNITLQATASSGLPVQYWMNCGPYLFTNGTVADSNMVPQTLSARATFPMRVMVGAYQWGTRAGTQYAHSPDTYQTFWIFKDAAQKLRYETYGTLSYSNVITATTATNGPQIQPYWIMTNHPPVATVMTVTRTEGVDLAISLTDVATNWSDVDGDPVSLTGVNMLTTNGVSLIASNWSTNLDGSIVSTDSSAFIYYTNSPSMADQISYSISDGQGGTNVGYINIVMSGVSLTGTNSIASISNGYPTIITAYGVIGESYATERTTNLSPAAWAILATNLVDTNGVISVSDYFGDLGSNAPSSAYYRLRWVPKP